MKRIPTEKDMAALVRAHEIECDRYGRGERDTHLLTTGAALREAYEALIEATRAGLADSERLTKERDWLAERVEVYGISYAELRDRIEAIQRGEFSTHEEVMRRVAEQIRAQPNTLGPCVERE